MFGKGGAPLILFYFYFFKMSHFIGSSPIFLEHGALPFTHLPPPSFTSYIDRNMNHGKDIWDKLWGVIWIVLGNKLGTWGRTERNLMRTFWKHSENTLGTDTKQKTPCLHPASPKKKLNLLEPSHWLHEILFPKWIVTIFNLIRYDSSLWVLS